jgi:hypothetical protein
MAAYVVEQGGFTFDLSKWLPSDIKGEPVEGTSNLGAALPNDPQQSPQVRAPRMRHPILHMSAFLNHARHPCFFISISSIVGTIGGTILQRDQLPCLLGPLALSLCFLSKLGFPNLVLG